MSWIDINFKETPLAENYQLITVEPMTSPHLNVVK